MSRSPLRMDVSPLRGSGAASFRVLYASRSVTLFGAGGPTCSAPTWPTWPR
jgi:hypothetical protein